MSDDKSLRPGSTAAQEAGCKCPVLDNNRGYGYAVDGHGEPVFVMDEDCPIHGKGKPGMPETKRAPITDDEDCCDVWPKIATTFEWMRYTDQPDMCTMPHIESCYGKGKFFVNFCPSCGKDVRNRNMLARRLRGG